MITPRIRVTLACAFKIDKARDAILWNCDSQGNFTQRELSKEDLDRLGELYNASLNVQEQARLRVFLSVTPIKSQFKL